MSLWLRAMVSGIPLRFFPPRASTSFALLTRKNMDKQMTDDEAENIAQNWRNILFYFIFPLECLPRMRNDEYHGVISTCTVTTKEATEEKVFTSNRIELLGKFNFVFSRTEGKKDDGRWEVGGCRWCVNKCESIHRPSHINFSCCPMSLLWRCVKKRILLLILPFHSQAPDARHAFCVRPKIAPPGRAWAREGKEPFAINLFSSVAKYSCVRLFDFRAKGI